MAWRALVNRKAFLDAERTDMFAGERYAMMYLASERLGFLAPLLACSDYATTLLRQICSLREEIAPVLVGRRQRGFNFRRLGSAVERMIRIANLDFVVSRIRDEVAYDRLAGLFNRDGIPGLAMTIPGFPEPAGLVANMTRHLDDAYRHASSQLALLKQSYSEIVSYERIKSERAMQGALLFLTTVLLLLTAALLPQGFWSSLWALVERVVGHRGP